MIINDNDHTLSRRAWLRGAIAAGAVACIDAAAINTATRPVSAANTEKADKPLLQRPPVADRRFTSPVIEAAIAQVSKQIADAQLARIFANCLPNTLDTTVRPGTFEKKPDTFVITGDIDAMWLRDSSAQVWPYL